METKTGELSEECGEGYSFFTSEKKVTWKIPNFLDIPKRESCDVTSPDFRLANATWYFKLYPNLWEKFTAIDLCSTSFVPEHRIHHTTVLKTCHGDEYYCRSEDTLLRGTSQEVLCLQRSEITVQSELLLPNGTLTVYFQIRLKGEPPQAELKDASSQTEVPESVTQTGQQEASSQTEVPELVNQTGQQGASSQTEVPESVTQTGQQGASSQTEVPVLVNQTEVEEASTSVQKLQLDYSKLLKSEEDSDVCLKVSDKEFRAHRCILRARSKVFSAMFKHETEEAASGEVVIEDLDPNSFPDFLQHVYVGRVETLTSKNVSSLYSAADKYDLQELKSECRDYMKRTLSVDTFCDVMTLALMHQEEELLKLAIEFFSKNYTKIIVTVKWQTFLKDHYTEANELFIKALVPGENNESS